MIFKTFNSDIDKTSAKIGVFGKSFHDFIETAKKWNTDINKLTKENISLSDAKSQVGGLWSNLFPGKKDIKSKIINLDSKMPELDTDAARKELNNLRSIQNQINSTQGSWDDYHKQFDNGRKYLLDYAKQNNVLESSVDDIKEANKAARKSAIEHNKALEAQTFSAKAGSAALKALSTAGSILASLGLAMIADFAITKISEWITAVETAKEGANEWMQSLRQFNAESAQNSQTLSDLNSRYQELSAGVDRNGNNLRLTSEEYAEYKDIISQVSDIMPDLATQFNNQGEQIGFADGKLSDLTKTYQEYQKTAANSFVTGDGFDNVIDNLNYQDELPFLENLWNKGFSQGWMSLIFDNSDAFSNKEFKQALEDLAGMEQKEMASNMGNLSILEPDSLINLLNPMRNAMVDILDKSGTDISNMDSAEFNNFKESIQDYIQNYDSLINESYEQAKQGIVQNIKKNEAYWNSDPEIQDALLSFVSQMTPEMMDFSLTNKDGEFDKQKFSLYANELTNLFSDTSNGVLEAYHQLVKMDLDNTDLAANDMLSQIDNYIKIIQKGTGDIYFDNELLEMFGLKDFEDDMEQMTKRVKDNLKVIYEDQIGSLSDLEGDILSSLPQGIFSFGDMTKEEKEQIETSFQEKLDTLSLGDLEIASNLLINNDVLLSWDELLAKIEEYKNKTLEMTENISKGADIAVSAAKPVLISKAFLEQNLNLQSSLSSLKSEYESVSTAMQQYAEDGTLSSESLDAILALSDQTLNALRDENGQISLNSAAWDQLTLARLDEMKSAIYQNTATELNRIANLNAAEAANELAKANGTLSETAYMAAKAELVKLQNMGGDYEQLGNQVWQAAQTRISFIDQQIAAINTKSYSPITVPKTAQTSDHSSPTASQSSDSYSAPSKTEKQIDFVEYRLTELDQAISQVETYGT